MREHRYRFFLSDKSAIERSAKSYLRSHEDANPTRTAELIRRIMLQGHAMSRVVDEARSKIEEIERALECAVSSVNGSEYLVRLSAGDILADQDGCWKIIKESSHKKRNQYFRRMFLYGYWLESAAGREQSDLTDLVGSLTNGNSIASPEPSPPARPSAKSSLGSLMP